MLQKLSHYKTVYKKDKIQTFIFSQDYRLLETCQSIFKLKAEQGYMFSNFDFLKHKKPNLQKFEHEGINTLKFKAEKINFNGKHILGDIFIQVAYPPKPQYNFDKTPSHYIVTIEDLSDAYHYTPDVLVSNSKSELVGELKKIKSLQRLRNDHFAKIAHDIKLPLTEIVGTTYLMENHVASDKGKAYLKSLGNASKNLDNMLNDLVNFTKSQSMQLRMVQKPFALEQIIWSVIKSFEFKTTQQNVPIFLKVKDTIPQYLNGDSSRLSQIIYNLIDNALKFTKQGKIDIKISYVSGNQEDCRLLFEVQDTGIGIPAEKLKSIFETYSQVRSEDANIGFGIGLSIVKQLIELQKGTIEARSELGKGACFSFELPFNIANEFRG